MARLAGIVAVDLPQHVTRHGNSGGMARCSPLRESTNSRMKLCRRIGNVPSVPGSPDTAESLDATYVYGGAFSADGSLYFQPGSQAIDVFDGVTGAFRSRIALPVPLCPNFRALVSDGTDNRIIAITGNTGDGIAVIDLSSLPEPAPVTWLSGTASPAMKWNPQFPDPSSPKPLRVPLQTIRRLPSPLLRSTLQPH